jgi:hypothetical protein
VRPDRRTGYLGDVDWDRSWEPVVSSDDEDDEGEAARRALCSMSQLAMAAGALHRPLRDDDDE